MEIAYHSPVRPIFRQWLPECALGAFLLFVLLRELGTFPAVWADEGLFIIVAKMLAQGKGYGLPLMDTTWFYPYFLNVGPTLIVPSALSMMLFGPSIEAARFPMTLYAIAAVIVTYIFTEKLFDRTAARWTTALLVTLSAFINTAKPVLGESPGFFFLMIGLILLLQPDTWKRGAGSGFAFGLAVVTKITYGLILPALGCAWLLAIWKRKWIEVKSLTISILLTLLLFAAWRAVEMSHTLGAGLTQELHNFLIGGDSSPLFSTLLQNPDQLTRVPYLAYGVFLLLGGVGLWKARRRLDRTLTIVVTVLIALFTLYFLNGFLWYRLLLPAHLLLLPFVPSGAMHILTKRNASLVLGAIVLFQAFWQLDHRGSGRGTTPQETAAILERDYADQELYIVQTEVFSRLPGNPHWKFLTPHLSFSLPQSFSTVSGDQCQIPIVQKLTAEEEATYADHALRLAGSFFLLRPPYPCPYSPP
jgi:4-amino-4-deoxy-L-arabinose transferase-like glycosyltransferase